MVDGSMGMERSSGAALDEMAVELAAAGPLRLRPSLVDFSGLSRSQLPRRLMMGMKGIAGVPTLLENHTYIPDPFFICTGYFAHRYK
jgi:hypothetical protein